MLTIAYEVATLWRLFQQPDAEFRANTGDVT